MRSRLARLGILAAGVIGLLATGTPSASAQEAGSIAFSGEATLSAPLGYPCTPNDVNTPKCPPNATTTTKNGLKDTPKANVDPGGQSVAFAFGATVCTGANATVGKAPKAPATAGACAITASGRVDGYCGLSMLKGTATIRFGPQTYNVTFWGQGVGGTLVLKIEGTKATGGGQVQGEVTAEAVPVPTVTVGPPPTTTNSCAGKTANNFTIAAEGNYIVKNPPLP
ncbi:MAG TPA: hypothetical protein VM938_10430 [Acidimicrobiales bacterium]|nr:hypothetical protein [Acidimicrobiales bacterium]